MRLATLLLAGLVWPAFGQPARQAAHGGAAHGGAAHGAGHGRPIPIGDFADWHAATHKEGGVPVCYIFTYAEAPVAQVPGRGDAVLSVARRDGQRDSVALSPGFVLTGHEDAVLQAGSTKLLFYIAGRSAFSRDSAAAVAAFGHVLSVAVHMHGPKGADITDRFGLKGFSAAYAAMLKACPTKP